MNDMLDVGDDVLSERTRAGDSSAFAELWRRHSRAAQAAARQFQSIADPEDIVSEAYLRILRALQGGGGPREAFRPYLYRTVRNVALTWNEKSPATEELPEDLVADGASLEDTVLENTITVRAFRTLPERWQSILWYTEVEGMDPAEAAPFLGLSANGAAALAYRAREGLKKAWLQAHISDERVPAECRWTTERMGDYRRNALTPRAKRRFEEHLDTCARCSILVEEIDEVSGRLAVMLFPLVLGGAAGAGILADLTAHGSASSVSAAAGVTRAVHFGAVRTVVGVATGMLGAAAIVTAGFTLPVLLQPAATSSQTVAGARVAPAPTHMATSSPNPVPPQTPSAPSAPQAPPSPSVPVQPTSPPAPAPLTSIPIVGPIAPPLVSPPAHTTPPAAPAVSSPSNGTLTNNPRPVFTGTGEPGARIEATYPAPPGAPAAMSAAVAPNGTWQLQPTTALPDGTHTVTFSQVDAAGNRSPAVTTTITIDTIALPPIMQPLVNPPLSHLLYLPIVTGTAEPGASVQISDAGTVVGTVTAGADGSWSFPLPDPGAEGTVVTATQTDRAGNISAPSAPSAPLIFDTPLFVLPFGPVFPSTGGATQVPVTLTGIAGMQVQILVDDVPTGNIHTLPPTVIPGVAPTITVVTLPLPNGPHTIGLRYIDPVTGRVGSLDTAVITIGP